MNIEIDKVSNSGKLCYIIVSSVEAIQLIKSLSSQLLDGPNIGRLESRCTGMANELTIVVSDDVDDA